VSLDGIKNIEDIQVGDWVIASLEPDILDRPPSLIRPDGRQEFLARGSIGDSDGVYHITVSADGQIDHRTFIPQNDWNRFARRLGFVWLLLEIITLFN